VSAGLLAVKAKPLRGDLRPALTAPTPYGIGSYARNREKTGQHLKKPVFKPALHFSRSTVYSRVIRTDTAGGTMARHFVLVDDLDGSEGAETITYTVNGQEYEIDLSEDSAEKFHDALEPYIQNSREVRRQAETARRGRGDGRRRNSGGGSSRDDIPQIRAWAESQGMDVSARGRVKKEIIDAYDEAHS
jgi:Lsr2